MYEGVVNLLKPPGMSSNNAVFDVRKLFGEKKAGHLGTLDPGAAGVLPVCLGRGVKLFDYLVDKVKTYRFELILGKATDTQDVFGQVVERSDAIVSQEALLELLPRFRGDIIQQAPAYSALKSNGVKLYDLALKGKEIPEKLRPITISRLELIKKTGENRFLLEVSCSRGTYVRTLCHDIGHALGSCGCMGLLLRTASGPFLIENSYTIEELRELKEQGMLHKALLPCEQVLEHLPKLELPEERRIPTQNGLSTYGGKAPDATVRLYCGERFMGIGQVKAGHIRLLVHLYEER